MNLRSLLAVILVVVACATTVPTMSSLSAMQEPAARGGKERIVVLAIDTSGSMRRHLASLRATLPPLIEFRLPDDVLLSLVTFDTAVWNSGAPTVNRETIRKKLSELQITGNTTDLGEGALESLGVLLEDVVAAELQGKPAKEAVRRIILISDGPEVTRDDWLPLFIKYANEKQVVAHTVWIGRPGQDITSREFFRRISEGTGGTHTNIVEGETTMAVGLKTAFDKALAPPQ